MSSTEPLDDDDVQAINGDVSASQLVDAAKVDSNFAAFRERFNALLVALAVIQRDDNQLVDAIVRARCLHPEVGLVIASANGWQLKAACKVAATGNITIAAPGATIDGYTLTSGDRVVLGLQTDATENGIYVWHGAASPMTRASDCDSDEDIASAAVPVYYGSLYPDTLWVMTTVDPVVGTDDTAWVYLPLTGNGTFDGGQILIQAFQAGVDFTPGSDTEITLAQAPGATNNLWVSFGAALQHRSTYFVTGSVITFDAAIPLDVSTIEVRHVDVVAGSIPPDDSVGPDQLQTHAVEEEKMADDAASRRTIPDEAVNLAKLDPEVMTHVSTLITAGIAAAFASGDAFPVGFVAEYPVNAAPSSKWLRRNGASLLRASYPALFALYGTTFGAADGTHFNLPDDQGRVGVGAGTGAGGLTARALGDAPFGAETVVLDATMIPSHTHANTLGAGHSSTGGSGGLSEANPTASTPNTGATGGGLAHNNMPPAHVSAWYVKALP